MSIKSWPQKENECFSPGVNIIYYGLKSCIFIVSFIFRILKSDKKYNPNYKIILA
jgi:hypothetical protein